MQRKADGNIHALTCNFWKLVRNWFINSYTTVSNAAVANSSNTEIFFWRIEQDRFWIYICSYAGGDEKFAT